MLDKTKLASIVVFVPQAQKYLLSKNYRLETGMCSKWENVYSTTYNGVQMFITITKFQDKIKADFFLKYPFIIDDIKICDSIAIAFNRAESDYKEICKWIKSN